MENKTKTRIAAKSHKRRKQCISDDAPFALFCGRLFFDGLGSRLSKIPTSDGLPHFFRFPLSAFRFSL